MSKGDKKKKCQFKIVSLDFNHFEFYNFSASLGPSAILSSDAGDILLPKYNMEY